MNLDAMIAATVREVLAEQLAELVAQPAVFNLDGAAKYMATSPQTIKALIDQGDLLCVKVGREYRVGRKQLDELLARGCVVELGAS